MFGFLKQTLNRLEKNKNGCFSLPWMVCSSVQRAALSSSGHPRGPACPHAKQVGGPAPWLGRVAFPWILSLNTYQDGTHAPRSFCPLRLLTSLTLFPPLFFFQHKGYLESYLTNSIKLTPNDKPKKSCC